MAWEQSSSASFSARHDTADATDAARMLRSLEHVRVQLGEIFPRVPERTTLVLHSHPLALALSNPLIAVQWRLTTPSGRRYVAGWAGREELHVLSPAALADRAAPVTGSREMLRLTAPALYARRVIAESNPDLARVAGAVRARRELRWAWLLEGAARWLAGQTAHARPAIARRLREGSRPAFPPGLRDAPLLGGTVCDLLARERGEGGRGGESAVAALASRLPAAGPAAALESAFDRGLDSIAADWRVHLAALAATA